MTRRGWSVPRGLLCSALWAAFLVVGLLTIGAQSARGQAEPRAEQYERTYRQSKSAVEKALKELQPSLGGRLPVLDGFALQGDRPLNRYQRAYYQSAVQVSSTASGGSVVRVSTKVTAWYADSIPSRSGYQLLTSNGRLESDLLDQLTELLASRPGATSSGRSTDDSSSETFPVIPPPAAAKGRAIANKGGTDNSAAELTLSAPVPKSPDSGRAFSSSWGSLSSQGLSSQQLADSRNPPKPLDRANTGLQAEAASLEEVLKTQAHPKNLVAIKKSGTPVVATPSLNGKTLFLASAHDEFEMLDFNADWVHVRISGL